MATRMRDAMFQGLDELRYEPVEKRVRALRGDEEVVDSSRPLLIEKYARVVQPRPMSSEPAASRPRMRA